MAFPLQLKMLRVPFQFAAWARLLANARMLAPLARSMIELDCKVTAPMPGSTVDIGPAVNSLNPAVLSATVAELFALNVMPALSLIRSVVPLLLNSKVPPLFTVTVDVPLAVDPRALVAAAFNVPALIVVVPV